MKFFAFLLTCAIPAYCCSQQWLDSAKTAGTNFQKIEKLFEQEDLPGNPNFNTKQFQRWKFFWRLRLDSNGNLRNPVSDIEAVNKFNSEHTNQRLTNVANANWQPAGPVSSAGGVFGIGRINCIGFHPLDTNIFYVGSATGGIWKTVDGGNSYHDLTSNIGPLTLTSIAVSPANSNLVFVGGSGPQNLYKSIDGGLSWTGINSIPFVHNIIVDPNSTNLVIVATSNGVYRSTNGGANFVNVLSISGEVQLKFKPGDFNTQFVTVSSGMDLRIYRSTNAGLNWNLVQTFLNGGQRPRMAVCNSSPNLVEIATCNSSWGLYGIYRSTDGGLSYHLYFTATPATNFLSYDAFPSSPGGIGYYAFAYAINPINENEKYITSLNTWRTQDNGTSWQLRTHWCCPPPGIQAVHADNHFLGFQPGSNKLFVTNDGGIYQTYNGNSWLDKTNGMDITQIYHVIPPPPSYNNVFNKFSLIGTQDNGAKMHKPLSGSWLEVSGGDAFAGEIDYNDTLVYYSSIGGGTILRHINGTVSNIAANIPGGMPPGDFSTNFSMNPRRSRTLLALYQDLYRTYDRGNTWQKITTNIFNGQFIVKLLVSPADTNVYVINNGNFFMRSTNGGQTWTNIKANLPVSGGIRDFTVHPTDPNKLYAIVHNTSNNAIWVSSNGGQTWTNISYNLPSILFNFIVVAQGTDDDLYINGDFGVFYRNNSMAFWIPYNTNLPVTYLNQLKISYPENMLLLATFGRGMWKSPLQNSPVQLKGGAVEILNGSNFNPSDIIQIRFAFNRFYFNYNNNFRVELSDSAGSFVTPNVISTISSVNNSVIASVALPSSMRCGNTFRIRVVADQTADTTTVSNPFIVGQVLPQPTITAAEDTICTGTNSELTAHGTGNIYRWFRNSNQIANATTNTISIIDSAHYAVEVQNATGCYRRSNSFKATLLAVPATPTISSSGNILTSSASTGNQWFLNGVIIPGATGSQITATVSGQYTVQVIQLGCSSTSLPFSFVVTGIVEPTWANYIRLQPNPTSLKLFLLNPGSYKLEITISDILGRQLKTQFIQSQKNEIDISKLSAGIYIFRMVNLTSKEKIHRVIVKL